MASEPMNDEAIAEAMAGLSPLARAKFVIDLIPDLPNAEPIERRLSRAYLCRTTLLAVVSMLDREIGYLDQEIWIQRNGSHV